MIKAIDTLYNGNYFRSRLEARWAVFFDVAGIKYEYESEGFIFNNISYLPDFYLPEFKCYAEVKPDISGIYEDGKFSEMTICQHPDINKWHLFSKQKNLILLIGKPHSRTLPLLNGLTWGELPYEMTRINPNDPIYNEPFFDTVGFYNDKGYWRFWVCGSGDEDFCNLHEAVLIANTMRFEHNK